MPVGLLLQPNFEPKRNLVLRPPWVLTVYGFLALNWFDYYVGGSRVVPAELLLVQFSET